MSRQVCPEFYPDPRPTRALLPLRPYLPLLRRALPWLAATPFAALLSLIVLTALPVLSWALLSLAVLAPVAAGLALFNYGWE